MSKGNLFMGFGRGKVGSVVLARSKGQQVARAYNDAPKNPRSKGQMLQRSIFASAVKFYSQGRQAFYQFAFENKNSKQSDYNAFASANAKRGMRISKMAFDESTYPVLASWMMSKGSLPELELTFDTANSTYVLALPGLAAGANWGAVSQLLKDTYGLNGGDIVTIITINAQGSDASNTPAIEPEKRGQIKWDIKQVLLDVDSVAAVADIFGTGATAVAGAIQFMGVATATTACGACVTVSRITDGGLKVNDSYIVLNGVAETIYEACQAQGYIDEVLASWKASGKAILEGGLLPEANEAKPYFTPSTFKFENSSTSTNINLFNADGTPFDMTGNEIESILYTKDGKTISSNRIAITDSTDPEVTSYIATDAGGRSTIACYSYADVSGTTKKPINYTTEIVKAELTMYDGTVMTFVLK